MALRILTLPGDGPSRDSIQYALDAISLLVPNVESQTAEYGYQAWDDSNDILPPDTEDAIANADTVLCGNVRIGALNKKDPLDSILVRNGLQVRVTSYSGLWSTKPIEACVISPQLTSVGKFRELEGLDGVEAHHYSSRDDIEHLLKMAVGIVNKRGYSKLTLVTDSEMFPMTSIKMGELFDQQVQDLDIVTEKASVSQAAMALASKPAEAGAFVTSNISSFALYGEAYGLLGTEGLMGNTFVGEGMSLYSESRSGTGEKAQNPTSAIMIAQFLLIDKGYVREGNMIKQALQETYRQRLYPAGIAGKRSPADFFNSFVEILNEL